MASCLAKTSPHFTRTDLRGEEVLHCYQDLLHRTLMMNMMEHTQQPTTETGIHLQITTYYLARTSRVIKHEEACHSAAAVQRSTRALINHGHTARLSNCVQERKISKDLFDRTLTRFKFSRCWNLAKQVRTTRVCDK